MSESAVDQEHLINCTWSSTCRPSARWVTASCEQAQYSRSAWHPLIAGPGTKACLPSAAGIHPGIVRTPYPTHWPALVAVVANGSKMW